MYIYAIYTKTKVPAGCVKVVGWVEAGGLPVSCHCRKSCALRFRFPRCPGATRAQPKSPTSYFHVFV